jgi:hypothetical protein
LSTWSSRERWRVQRWRVQRWRDDGGRSGTSARPSPVAGRGPSMRSSVKMCRWRSTPC